jgi:hypothetical protein
MLTLTYRVDSETHTVRLSPAQHLAIVRALDDGTIHDTGRQTQYALIQRGLADEVRGTVLRLNRHGNVTREFHNVFAGARLNAHGKAVRNILRKVI